MLTSKLCTQSDIDTDQFQYWCNLIGEKKRYHRKQWEFVQIAQALNERYMITENRKGLGFGVGTEPLVSLFANFGVEVTATDLDISDPAAQQWDNGQLSKGVSSMYKSNIFHKDYETFEKLVNYRAVDMNNIPEDLKKEEFDFTWSSCSFEHLGSIEKGLDFIVNQMDCLKKGGVAVHTTEFNLNLDATDTMDNDSTVIFRKSDIEKLGERLLRKGCILLDVDYDKGNMEIDNHIDIAPYNFDHHLKLQLSSYETTSIILIIQK